MILKNPETGAPITKFSCQGKRWAFPVNEILRFSDEVGAALLETYPFLKKLENVETRKPEILEMGDADNLLFKCSLCEYNHPKKIGVIGHQRAKHSEPLIDVKDAVPVGDAPRNPTLMEMRKKHSGMYDEPDLAGPEVYGDREPQEYRFHSL